MLGTKLTHKMLGTKLTFNVKVRNQIRNLPSFFFKLLWDLMNNYHTLLVRNPSFYIYYFL